MKKLYLMNEWGGVKQLLLAICSFAAIAHAQAQTDQAPEGMRQQLEEQMQYWIEQLQGSQLGLDSSQGGTFFMDTTIIQDFTGGIPMDSLFQTFSFSFPGMQRDSSYNLGQEGNPFGGFEELFRSFDQFGPESFNGMEDLLRELEQNGLRAPNEDYELGPDGKPKLDESGQLKKKRKIYKI